MLGIAFLLVILSVLQHRCSALKAPCFQAQDDLEDRLNDVPGMMGWETPRCDTDGSYLGMQYDGSVAHCVTRWGGEKIEPYQVPKGEGGPDMNCNCARDQEEYRQTGMMGKMFHCARNGNYGPYGCTGSVCYCQDENGEQIGSETVPISASVNIECD